MSKRYLIPEGMRKAFGAGTDGFDPEGYMLYPALESAIGWLDRQLEMMKVPNRTLWQAGRNSTIEAVREMFLVPAPEVPRDVKDLLVCDYEKECSGFGYLPPGIEPEIARAHSHHNLCVLEAYRRGKESK